MKSKIIYITLTPKGMILVDVEQVCVLVGLSLHQRRMHHGREIIDNKGENFTDIVKSTGPYDFFSVD